MSNITAALEASTLGLHPLDRYEPLIGAAATERILKKARSLPALHAVHISSTFYGGGVTEILTPLTLMMNTLGIETGWRMIQGTPSFFAVTKKLHNMLQGEAVHFSDAEKAVYEEVVFENSTRMHIADCDAVIVHDPQPLPLIRHLQTRGAPWISATLKWALALVCERPSWLSLADEQPEEEISKSPDWFRFR